MSLRERDSFIDFLKGIGILLVIYNHCGSMIGANYIAAFHIPLFFFISGICNGLSKSYINISVKSFLIKKIKSLLIPYFTFGIIDLVLYFFFSPFLFKSPDNFVRQLIFFLLGKRNFNYYYFTGAIWFITALFSCELIFFLINHFIKKILIKLAIFILISFSAFYFKNYNETLPLNIDVFPFILPFFCFGFYFSKWNIYLKYKETMSPIFLSLPLVFLFYFTVKKNIFVDVFSRSFGNILLFWLNGFIGIFLIQEICKILVLINDKWLNAFLSFIGCNSIFFLGIHQQWILHPMNSLKIILPTNKFNFVLRFVICIAGCSVLVFLIKKIRKLIGILAD